MPKVEGVLGLLVDGVFGRLQVDGVLGLLDEVVLGLLIDNQRNGLETQVKSLM